MTYTKSPENISLDRLETVIGYVRDIVAMFRRRGHKTEYVMPEIAGLLDAKPQRVRSLFYRDKLWSMSEAEAARIERRFAEHIDREISITLDYVEGLRAKRNQLNLRLSCSDGAACSVRGGGTGSRASG
jgi:hypothetical protein